MTITLAFDVYGTLIDPFGVTGRVAGVIGDDAERFTQSWRNKQIEYLFRRGLGRDYESFSVCTEQALDYTCLLFSVRLSASEKDSLLSKYLELPAYAGVDDALCSLKDGGYRNFAFSNGEPDDLQQLLTHAGLAAALDGIVSVDAVKSYKPDPAVYAYFLQQAGSTADDTWLVSANPFDVIGAHNAGWQTVWVRRNPAAVFDPWGVEPTATVAELNALAGVFS